MNKNHFGSVCTKNQAKNKRKYLFAPKFNDFVAHFEHASSISNISWAISVSFKPPQDNTDASETLINYIYMIYGQKYAKNW